MAVAQIIVGGRYKYGEEETDLTASSSMDFTLRAPEEEELEDSLDFAEPALDSLVEVKQLDIWLISSNGFIVIKTLGLK